MALPNKVLPGFSASLWCQTGTNPVPLSVSNLAIWTAEVATIVGTTAGGTGSAGEQLNVEAIPAFGQDDASANFMVAGARQSDIIPTQAKPTSLTITAADSISDTSGNYVLQQPQSLSATITPKVVSLSATKTYDGTTSLTGAITLSGLIGSETLTYTGATALSANVLGTNYINAITLANGTNGGLASNYALPSLTGSGANNSVNFISGEFINSCFGVYQVCGGNA